MDIAAWLRRLGLERYEQAFRDNAVDGEVLPSLTAKDLKDLGVAAVGDRRRLLDAIASLRAAAEPDRAPARPPENDEPAGERRQVVVLFADLAGYTALSRELDVEDVHALLGRFFERVDRVVEEHGGRVDKHLGDCVMAVFGAPLAHGNEAERAVRAALAARDAMPAVAAEAGRPVDVHVGIAGGQVVASGTGSASHREYTVTGDSVNLASRLTDAAPAGEILVSDAIRRALGDRLDADELDPLQVKGFAEPVRAWRLRGLRPQPVRAALVGRAGELDRFRRLLKDCRATGRGRAVHVRGEAGIGKTRLLDEFREEARRAGFSCHAGLVLDFGAGTGRDAVRALVRGILGLTVSSGPGEAATAAAGGLARGLLDADDAVFLNDLLDVPQPSGLRALYDAMDPATRDAGKRQAASRLVERASRDGPLLLLVEDLHWADPPTLAHLAGLARTARRCPALLVTTSRLEGDRVDGKAWRAEAGDDGAPLAMHLGPLDLADARALAAPFLAANAALAERCVERAAGNPLFLEQLLRHAEEDAGAGVPGSVQSLVQARLDRLDPADKTALQAASVLGQRFDLAAWRHVLGRPSYDPHGLAARLLVRPEGDGFLFAHALVRDAVYDSLLKSRRRELHRRAAAWFERRDPVLWAEHLDRADDPAAARAYHEAGRSQAAAYRYELALRLAERGSELAADRVARFGLSCFLGDILHDLGAMPEAKRAYERALADAADEAERCQVWIGLAAVKRVTDDLEGAAADLDRAEAVAAARGMLAEEARVHSLRGNLCFPKGDIEGCLREHRRSLGLARQVGAAESEAAALGGLGDAEYVRGRMISAHARLSECVGLARRHGFGRIEVANLAQVAHALLYFRPQGEALGAALGAAEAAARIGHLRAELNARVAAYFALATLDEPVRCQDQVVAAQALVRRLGAWRFEQSCLLHLGWVALRGGRPGEAVTLLRQAHEVCVRTGPTFHGPQILGVLALAFDHPEERRRALAQSEAMIRAGCVGHNQLRFYPDAIDVALQLGDHDEAERYAAALEGYTRPEPLPWSAFHVARGRALAAAGRHGINAARRGELALLRGEGERLGYLGALPTIDAALAGAA